MAAEQKRKALIYLLCALGVTILIAMALPRLRLEPGMPMPSFENGEVAAAPAPNEPPVGMPISSFLKMLFFMLMAGCAAYVAYRLIKGVPWREVLGSLLTLVPLVVVVVGIIALVIALLPHTEAATAGIPLPEPVPVITAPLGPVPSLLIWLVAAGLLAAMVLLGIWIFMARREPAPEAWELGAARARQALLEGGELRDVILRCYHEMSRTLQEDREIERQAAMTTGEFERLLAAKGVPAAPVHDLTQLFDAVRYGHWSPNAPDEGRALASLDAILAYSRAAKES